MSDPLQQSALKRTETAIDNQLYVAYICNKYYSQIKLKKWLNKKDI